METPEEKKVRRAAERARRKMNKKRNQNDVLIACSQNYNGSSSRDKMEETSRQMQRQKIGIVFGQEGRRPSDNLERRDTGELFIGFGEKPQAGPNTLKDGNFFILDAEWKHAFVRGGKQMTKHSPRLVTIRIPIHGGKHLYLVNAHFPDSSKSKAVKQAYQLLFERAMNEKGHNDVVLVMGDFNASTGISEGEGDLVCGPHGISHQDAAGRLLKTTAGMLNLVDLVTWEVQKMSATYYDIGTKKGRQIDRAFVLQEHHHMVERCVNAAMLVDSDHESVRINMVMRKAKAAPKTKRKQRGGKDVNGTFGPNSNAEQLKTAVHNIVEGYEENLMASTSNKHTCLMAAVCSTIESLEKRGPIVSGWCDENEWVLTFAIQSRNRASRAYSQTKSSGNLAWFRETRTRVKIVKRQAKNQWLLQMARACNVGPLPGGMRSSDPKAIWGTVAKLRRGADKWKGSNIKNVRNKDGILGKSPADNADNFQHFYEELYANDGVEGGKADAWFNQMPQRTIDREWRAPQRFELLRAVRELKTTAPGLTGVPAIMWKAIVKDEQLQEVMLNIMAECWETGTVPEEWLVYYMTVLEKKGDKTLCENYRGISIGETFSKVYTQILKYRLSSLYEKLAPEYSNGFRKGRGRSDSIYSLLQVLRLRKRKGLNSWVTFFDVQKFFDRIPQMYIWKAMRLCGVCEKMVQAVKSTLDGAKCMLHIDGEVREVPMKNGSGQGTILGPLLSGFSLLPIMELWVIKWITAATIVHVPKPASSSLPPPLHRPLLRLGPRPGSPPHLCQQLR